MPIYFYSPLQTHVIRKRMTDLNPTIGFVFSSKSLRVTESSTSNPSTSTTTTTANTETDPTSQTIPETEEEKETLKMGILAEIISASYQNNENEILDFSSLVENAGGIILKIKGRDRFRILNVSKDITGCYIGKVRILPEYVLDTNPLLKSTSRKNTSHFYESYLFKGNIFLS